MVQAILPLVHHRILILMLNMQDIGIISVLEAEASRARGHSGHEAPPMTHSLVLLNRYLCMICCPIWNSNQAVKFLDLHYNEHQETFKHFGDIDMW